MNRNDIAKINETLGTKFPLDAKIVGRDTLAMDADYSYGTAQTAANGGIPAFLTTWVDPSFVKVVVAPMRMAEIFTEVKKGDRTTSSVSIPVRELNGFTSTYGDFNDNGVSGSNMNWVSRQPYAYQTHVKIGEIETEIAAQARYDLVSAEIESNILTLNKFQNLTYLYGVEGLQNYGTLNDPSLLPDTVGVNWATLDSKGLFDEFKKLYTQLVKQANGLVKARDPMTLVLSPAMEALLHDTNMYGLNAFDLIMRNWPNLKIESVPEYSTAAGEKIQLILDEYLGRKTVELAFPDKLRTHAVEVKTSGWLQKRSQSTLGAIVYYPVFIAGMLASNTP